MYSIGLKCEWTGVSTLVKFAAGEAPENLPENKNRALIVGIPGPAGEELFVCTSVEDVLIAKGKEMDLNWYLGQDPVSSLVEEVLENLTGDTMSIVCQCTSFNCGMSTEVSIEEAESVLKSGLIPIVEGCKKGPELTDVWVEKRIGYTLYREI